ncbi:MAG TPA: M1 family aminopeptidase [Acidobacteriota bacterium]|nr:M1 family aminopeptidase [Acidobacteriota bacterium]
MQGGRLKTWTLLFIAMSIACDTRPEESPLQRGVSRELAQERSRRISQLRYRMRLDIPEQQSQPIEGRVQARFSLSGASRPLALDFNAPAQQVLAVRAQDQPAEGVRVGEGHILLQAPSLKEGDNVIEVDFIAGDSSLNRRQDYLYTLFVPDRASTSFPLFDQPDLKARFTLELEMPASWTAVANGALEACEDLGEGRRHCRYAETQPIPSYLLAFAAGKFEVEEWHGQGRPMRFLHRESDADKVARNAQQIFELHQRALTWLEDYTDIDYPFAKFDFALIPSFQYGGMEHPGAIFYRADRLFLEESATQSQQLGRTSLIAHETAHMWFGDLVTMEWFNDVWTKEVFANFMAAKIVHPSFPQLDHDLRFLLAHYPSAYAVDRSRGANPIRQELDNLLEAGTLYGAIIYQKAPIVMKHLELLVGEDNMRRGLRRYLSDFAYGNATWPDLIAILDESSPLDLKQWSHAWVEEPGRPNVRSQLERDEQGRIASLTLQQSDPWGQGRQWTQDLNVLLAAEAGSGTDQTGASGHRLIPVRLEGSSLTIGEASGEQAAWILPNGSGIGYGYFQLDPDSLDYLLHHFPDLEAPMHRALAWMTLWEAFLHQQTEREALTETLIGAISREPVEQIVERLLSDLQTLYWRFWPASERRQLAPRLEEMLWGSMETAEDPSLKKTFFDGYSDIALTPQALQRLAKLVDEQQSPRGLTLSPADYTSLALMLAVQEAPGWRARLDQQSERLENPERRQRLEFIRPAADHDAARRRAFFESLRDAQKRRREPWVLTGLHLLHHPLRAEESQKLIRPSLEMLPEIQRTGDIFFPKRWLDAVLGGHRSTQAAETVQVFLDENPDLPPRLRGKVLQSADLLFRAAR